MGTPAFPDLGKHCSVEECRLIDFLPFTCDQCDKVFCLQHRSFASHQCPNADQADVTVLVCPLCAQGVRLVPNEDPNITWDAHVNGNCDPSNYQKATKKKRCPVPGCKEPLALSNTVRCKDCAQQHCLRHRFGPDHNCPKAPKPVAGSSSGSAIWSSKLLKAASSISGSLRRLTIATNHSATDGGDLAEQCVQCRAKFGDVAALIDHVEKVHDRQAKRAPGGRVTVDVCPRCSRAFRDPVLLVEHVDRDHGGFSRS